MSKYGYDETQHLMIEAEAIDKDGFHKKVDIGSGFSSDVKEGLLGTLVLQDTNDGSKLIVSIIINTNNHSGIDFVNDEGDVYIYFGDKIDNSAFEIANEGGYVTYISNSNDLGLFSFYDSSTVRSISDNILFQMFMADVTNEYPNNFDNMMPHIVMCVKGQEEVIQFDQIDTGSDSDVNPK